MKCRIDKNKGVYMGFDFIVIEDGKEERCFSSNPWWKKDLIEYGTDKKNLIVVEKGRVSKLPIEFEEKFEEFLKKGDINIPKKKYEETKKFTIQDFMDTYNIGRNYSIGYGETRTLKRSHMKEVIGCIESYGSGLIIFKKRGGYLAYCFAINSYGVTFNVMDLSKALNDMKEVKEKKVGRVYWKSKEDKEEFVSQIILNKI